MYSHHSGRVEVGFGGSDLSEPLLLLAYAKDALGLVMRASDGIPPALRNVDDGDLSPTRVREQYLRDSLNLNTIGRQWLALWNYEVYLDYQLAMVGAEKVVDIHTTAGTIFHLLDESIVTREVLRTENASSEQDLASGDFRQFAEIIMLLRALYRGEQYRSWSGNLDLKLSRPPTPQEREASQIGQGIHSFHRQLINFLMERVQDLPLSRVMFSIRAVPSDRSWIWHHGLYVMMTEGLGDEALQDARTMDAVVQFLFDIVA